MGPQPASERTPLLGETGTSGYGSGAAPRSATPTTPSSSSAVSDYCGSSAAYSSGISTAESTPCSTGVHKRALSADSGSAASTTTAAPHGARSQPLAPPPSQQHDKGNSVKFEAYCAETLQQPHTTLFLLTITFSTAVLDSMTYNRFSTFASNQTGNTVFLALAATHWGQRKLMLTVTSFAGFVASGLLFGQLGAWIGHRRRGWVLASLVFQIIVLAVFTALAAPGRHPTFEKNGRWEWALMLLAAVQSGPQVTMGTNLDNLLPTAMFTSPIAGLISDPDLFSLHRAPTRDKRLAYVLTFIIGAHVGLASDVIFGQWTTAFLALSIKVVAFVMAINLPGSPP